MSNTNLMWYISAKRHKGKGTNSLIVQSNQKPTSKGIKYAAENGEQMYKSITKKKTIENADRAANLLHTNQILIIRTYNVRTIAGKDVKITI